MAVSMNHRMVLVDGASRIGGGRRIEEVVCKRPPILKHPKRASSLRLRAWVVSVGVHVLVLAAFGAAKFSGYTVRSPGRDVPAARVIRAEKLMRTAAVIPKPKVRRAAEQSVVRSADVLPVGRIFDAAKPNAEDVGNLAKPSASESSLLLTSSANLSRKIEFFGSFTDQRKICYVVDCSGSMRGVFGQVRSKLKESIRQLQADQYFCIIFFGSERLFEFADGRLVRATPKARVAAYDFTDRIRPAGRTNALAALERALQIRDGGGFCCSTVYFLTDGFELAGEAEYGFAERAVRLQRRFAPTARIHTIGFWPQSTDRAVLEAMARQTGGESVFVCDGHG